MTNAVAQRVSRYLGHAGDRSAYRIVPLERLTKPRAGALDCWTEHFWAVCDEGALFFRGHAAQCNTDRRIVERICPSWARVEYIPVAFDHHECESC